MRLLWDERKRRSNLRIHGIDFRDAHKVFAGPTYTYDDDRFDYDERRFVTLGFLGEMVVSMVHTETSSTLRIISFRKATRNETSILLQNLKD